MRCLLLFCLLLVLRQAAAQQPAAMAGIPVISYPKPAKPVDSTSLSRKEVIPFRRVGNLILLQATADTTTGNFLFDTGAPGLVLNLTYFRQYQKSEVEDRGSVSGAVIGAAQTTIDQFSFGGLAFRKVAADIINLGHIEDRRGIKILGLIGVSFFKDAEVIIDYEKEVLYVHRIAKSERVTYRHPLLDTARCLVLNFNLIDNKIIVRTRLGKRAMKFFIDTGAESSVLDSRLPNTVFDNMTITGRTKVVGTGNRMAEALYGNLRNMQIGTETLASLPFVVTNLENACISEVCCIDGILGFSFLSVYKVGFNFVKGEMYLWK
jgi:predicted aspartyl protease